MALVVADRVQETSLTSGTGTLTLSGAVSGFQTFSTAIGNGNTTFYTIYDPTAYDWEVGIGTVGAGTLARTTVLSNSAGTTSPISFASNAKFVFCTYPAEKSINYDANGVATIGSTLGYSDTGIIASFASTVAGYNQVVLQNKSTATNASTNFNVSNDAGTSGANYAELGINSSTFTGSGSFNIAGASYVASASTDLTLGTYGAYSIHFVTNSSTTDAMTIFNNGGISLGGFANPGIANMAASKFVPGYTGVTSAAGTTVLTASSNYYQNLLGTTTQTFRLPDATTLLVGTTFIFDNDSTGTLTVVDNASGSVDTIPGGALGYVYLANNSTVAGTWRRHAFLPASYDFNNTTANFGNATITNAVWNGTTIASGYGGTGLTTFTAANNALYSTNATTLVAGTLPIAAGGTAKTTFTANGVVYGDGTNPLGVTAAGTTGQVLIGNTGAAPSWGTVSSSLVSSFQTSLSGLTPSTATTGAVTLAGTLGATSGGTGLSAYTTGDIIYSSATNTLARLADVATGNALISGGVGVAPSWGKIGLTTHVSGTLPTANGGTNLTSFTSGGALYATSTSALTTGTLPIASGGTSATTAAGAFDALNPMTTLGDIIYEGTGPTATRLGIGSTGQVLTVSGGIPSWATPSGGVTSFQTSLSGLTPSTATTGAVTLAGTLGVTSGGTGSSTAFTTGSVVFAGASGTYTQNNANFFWDNTNSRLGIGIAAPTVRLDVIGSIKASAASTQDGVILAGRAGGTSSYAATLTPTTLTASRTITLPDATTTMVGTDTTQTLTNKTLTDPAIIGAILEDIFTITDGAAFEIDPSNGTIQLITLGANRTPKATNFAAGESVTLMVNDGTAYTLTWTDATFGTGGVIWVGGFAPTLAATGYTVIEFWKVGSQVYGAIVGSVA